MANDSGNQSNKVYLGNIPFATTEDQIRNDLFKGYEIVEVKIPTDRDTGRVRGFAFVEFATPGEAEGAVTNFDGQELGGRTLKISIARPREDRHAGGGGPGGRRRDGGHKERGGQRGERNDRRERGAVHAGTSLDDIPNGGRYK